MVWREQENRGLTVYGVRGTEGYGGHRPGWPRRWVYLFSFPGVVGAGMVLAMVAPAPACARAAERHPNRAISPDSRAASDASNAAVLWLPIVLRLRSMPLEPHPTLNPPSTTPTSTPKPEPTPRPGPSKPTAPADPAPAMDVYAGCTLRDEEDTSGDDQPERIFITEFDARSRITRVLSDYDADTVAEMTETWRYGADGLMRYERRSKDGDNLIKEFTYDDAARLVLERWTRSDGGDPITVIRYTYDERGRLAHDESDALVDGQMVTIRVQEYGYDDQDRRIWRRDGKVLHRFEWAGDTIVADNIALDRDDEVDWRYEYVYDRDRRMLRWTADLGPPLDGVPEKWSTFNFDQHGWLVESQEWRGEIEAIRTWRYDGEGRLVGSVIQTVGGSSHHHYVATCPSAGARR